MIANAMKPRLLPRFGLAVMGAVLATTCLTAGDQFAADKPASTPANPEPVRTLTLAEAVQYALEYNPEIAAVRQQRGIAEAGVVIARTYPFNPTWEGKVRAADGPASAGITNRVSNEHKLAIDLELRGQGRYRRQGAYAALTRTDWEIAALETSLAVHVVRAYYAILYRREKLKLIEEGVRLNEKAAEDVKKLRDAGNLTKADPILIETEIADARAQRGPGRAALVAAWHEFRRALGVTQEIIDVKGALTLPAQKLDAADLLEEALERRPDRHAREAALSEAEAKVGLEFANRYGNLNIGPAYEYDPTRINLIGFQVITPLPLVNTHRGEILQRQAERERAARELLQNEVQIRQDVYAAVARLENARAAVKTYETDLLPRLRDGLDRIEKLLEAGDKDVSLLSVIDVRRKLLKARDGYLDALWEQSQAQADLEAAMGVVTEVGPGPR
jgi:cobalt-zinc-cadmium efflux system outer membrane protein